MKICCLLAFLFTIASPIYAYACIPAGPSPDELPSLIERAEIAFIGSVVSTKKNKVMFKIEKELKNSNRGDSYSTMLGQHGLECQFPQIGQVWLYYRLPDVVTKKSDAFPRPLAAGPPHGGIYLRDSYGRFYMTHNISVIKDKLGYDLYSAKIPVAKAPENSPDFLSLTPANIASWQKGKAGIEIELTDAGKEKLFKITRRNIGKKIEIYIGNILIVSPLVNNPLKNGRLIIFPDKNKEIETLSLLPKEREILNTK